MDPAFVPPIALRRGFVYVHVYQQFVNPNPLPDRGKSHSSARNELWDALHANRTLVIGAFRERYSLRVSMHLN